MSFSNILVNKDEKYVQNVAKNLEGVIFKNSQDLPVIQKAQTLNSFSFKNVGTAYKRGGLVTFPSTNLLEGTTLTFKHSTLSGTVGKKTSVELRLNIP